MTLSGSVTAKDETVGSDGRGAVEVTLTRSQWSG